MTNDTAATLTDIILGGGTLLMGFSIGKRKTYRTWTALFISLGIAAGLGAIYHGITRFHTPEFWTLVSCASVASTFLFFAACLCATRPQWIWLHWLWPLMGIAGVLLGGALAPMPFYYISIVAGISTLLSALALKKSPSIQVRNWIYLGICITLTGLVVQKITNFDGWLSANSLFHMLQLAGNFCIWIGARKS